MSVINQMLKDLDKRQSDQQENANASLPLPIKNSMTKAIIITIAVIVVLNIIGLFGWRLYSENQQLKSQVYAEKTSVNAQATPVMSKSKIDTNNNESSIPTSTKQIKATELQVEKITTLSTLTDSHPLNTQEEQLNSVITKSSEANKLTDLASNETVIVAPIEPVLKVVQAKPQHEPLAEKVEPSLTISRTQLSPQALAANKITQAEKAMERNDIAKAESLFEEVLMLVPAHETARKQLAALWYGKKYYQDAINLLSQGIAIAPQAEEMRLMSARIYFEQEQARPAYNILKPINLSNSTEVQTLLANVSAALNEHESAIFAYRKLITLEPEVGRWWLGVAVSLDSLGKFVPARDAYKESIASNNLSMSAMQFAQQRLIELGE